jgi:excisionase family DNA binding protein
MSERLAFEISDAFVERIAVRAAEIVLTRSSSTDDPPRWLYGAAEAARYLGWSTQKVYKCINELPHHRIGQRLAFLTSDLDRYMLEHRE